MKYRETYHIIRADEEKKYLDVELYKFEAEDDSGARSLAEERLSEIKSKDAAISDCRVFVIYLEDF